MIGFGREITGDLDSIAHREWLVTNGIGGYAMGTPAGIRTRRYHGALIAALKPPAMRTLLVASLDTWLEVDTLKYPLCTHQWGAGVLLPDGYLHLEHFALDGTIPTWVWTLGDIRVVQRLWMPHGENTTYITYEYQRGTHPITLQVIPLCALRDHHGNTKGGARLKAELITASPFRGVRMTSPNGADPAYTLRLLSDADSVEQNDTWWWSFHMLRETERGLADKEDLFAAGTFRKALSKPGDSMMLICTTESGTPELSWHDSLANARAHERDLLAKAQFKNAPEWINQLVLAADQFVVDRKIKDDAGKSVIAGYPWFADWSRDTMIALPGLTLAVNRPEIAAAVLRTFAHFVDQGMLPNRFPDDGQGPEYNTVDGTLWYFEAIRAYLAFQDDPDIRAELYPVLADVIDWHVRGTRYSIHVDSADGLLYAGEAGTQLTWMDVKIGDRAITPRVGKPVEINALWYNALCIMSALAEKLGKTDDATRYTAMAARARESFNTRFWSEKSGHLFDVIDTPQGDDASLRPNQLIAISLANPVLDPASSRARAVVDVCAQKLLTSAGLRSLSPESADYAGRYDGNSTARDTVYHQGTVWSWLIGPFASAHFKVYKDATAALTCLEPLGDLLSSDGLGTIAEIFDGNSPHTPRGCIAQAWGVAEVLRAYRELEPYLK